MTAKLKWPIVRPSFATLAAVLLIAFGAWGAARLRLETDITALLPDRGEDRSALYELVRSAGFMRKVAIVVGPAEPGCDALHQAIDEVSHAVQATAGVLPLAQTSDMERVRLAAMTVASGAANLVGDEISTLDKAALGRRLEELKQRLAAPEAMVTQSFLLADPLGLGRPSLASLEGLSRSLGAVVERGHLLSADRRYGLVAVTLDFDPMDVDRAARFLAELQASSDAAKAKIADPKIDIIALGGVHFASSSAAAVRRDITRAFAFTSIAVALVFLVLFRRLRLLPAALLPGGLGMAAAVGVFSLLGAKVHGLTLGFAATLTGVSIDYAIHLLYHALSGDPSLDARQRMRLALERTARPIFLGCVTTVAAFLLVATSGFPGIRQLALFSALSVPLAMLTTLFVLPPFSRLLLAASAPPAAATFLCKRFEALLGAMSTRRARVSALAAAVSATAAFLTLAQSARLSGDPKDLGSHDPVLTSRQSFLERTFAGTTGQVFLVATGASLEQALQSNDALYAALLRDGVAKERIVSIAPVLPSLRRQAQSRQAVATVFSKVGGLEPLLEESGFTPQFALSANRAYAPPPLTKDSYTATALEPLIAESLLETNGTFTVLTRLVGTSEPQLEGLAALAAAVPHCSLVSERLETRAALLRMVREMARMMGIWLAVTLAALWLVRRSLRFAAAAVTPALLGVAAAIGVLALLGRPITPVASAGVTLVLGLGVDYGIFALLTTPRERGRTALAVLASALTTIAGFGVLAAASVRAMADLGLIILVGVTVCLLGAFFVAPVLGPHLLSEGEPR
ncbi:MAG: MMPL family transporter [Myxococcota bacterium]|jgi:predicted exporter|nr:MMPL family transporter [Myxococcota bacterium]